MSLRNVWMPLMALSRSGQLPPGPLGVHIEPVRSRTSMMSSGVTVHGEHAVAFADTERLLMPMIFPNHVGTLDDELTTTPFTPPSRLLHPGTPVMQTAWAVVAALLTVLTAFLFPGVALYCIATVSAASLSGRCWTPASAAASTPA